MLNHPERAGTADDGQPLDVCLREESVLRAGGQAGGRRVAVLRAAARRRLHAGVVLAQEPPDAHLGSSV